MVVISFAAGARRGARALRPWTHMLVDIQGVVFGHRPFNARTQRRDRGGARRLAGARLVPTLWGPELTPGGPPFTSSGDALPQSIQNAVLHWAVHTSWFELTWPDLTCCGGCGQLKGRI